MTTRLRPAHLASAIAAALCLVTGTAAHAQRAALVQNVDDGLRAPYQEGAFASGCNFAGNCAIVFPPVPAGHRRVVEQLSCGIYLSSGGLTAPLTLGSQAFRLARAIVPPQFVAGAAYAVNTPVLLYYEAGESPRVDAYASGPYSTFICTISGRDITLP